MCPAASGQRVGQAFDQLAGQLDSGAGVAGGDPQLRGHHRCRGQDPVLRVVVAVFGANSEHRPPGQRRHRPQLAGLGPGLGPLPAADLVDQGRLGGGRRVGVPLGRRVVRSPRSIEHAFESKAGG
jgi:hypothetical protein